MADSFTFEEAVGTPSGANDSGETTADSFTFEEVAQQAPSSLAGFTNAAANQLFDLATGIPNAAITGILSGPTPLDPVGSIGKLFEAATGQERPQFGERVIPTAEQLNETLGGPSVLEQQQLAAQTPVAAQLGEITGDVAALSGARLPGVARRAASRELAIVPQELPAGFKRLANRALDKIQRNVGGITKRARETGLQGAALAIADSGDPLQTGALAAGTQFAGSLAINIIPRSAKGALALTSAAAAATVAIQALKTVTPGGRDRSLESFESAVTKIVGALAVGTLAGAAGFGRVGGKFAQDLPRVADLITSVPRSAIISLIEQASKDDRVEVVLGKSMSEPGFFTASQRNRLNRAIRGGTLTETIDSLSKTRDFARKLEQIAPDVIPATVS